MEDLLDGDATVVHDGALSVTLEGYGYRWFRVRSTADPRTPRT